MSTVMLLIDFAVFLEIKEKWYSWQWEMVMNNETGKWFIGKILSCPQGVWTRLIGLVETT